MLRRIAAPPGLGSDTARLSALLMLSAVPARSDFVATVAASVVLLHCSIGGAVAARSTSTLSTPVCPQGPSCIELRPTAYPLSSAYQPVQPDSVNGLPPLPVSIRSGAGPPLP